MIVLDMIDKNENRFGLMFEDNDYEEALKVLDGVFKVGLRGRLLMTNITDTKKLKEYVDNLPWQ